VATVGVKGLNLGSKQTHLATPCLYSVVYIPRSVYANGYRDTLQHLLDYVL